MTDIEGSRQELRKLASDLAEVRMFLAFRSFDPELKFRPDQARLPKGQTGGGQFAKESGSAAGRNAAKIAARTAVANPEAAAAALRAGALPAAAGALGVSRAAGLSSVVASGGAGRIGGEGMTPLGVPFDLPVMMGAPPANTPTSKKGKFEEECDDQLKKDETECEKLAPSGAKSGYPQNQSYTVCLRQAIIRYGECRSGRGPSSIISPLFTLGKGH